MAQQAATSGAARNNGAVIAYAGAIDNTNTVTASLDLTYLGAGTSATPGPVMGSGNLGTVQANTSAPFAYTMVAGQYVAKRMTTELAGIANTQLLSGASDVGSKVKESIHFSDNSRRLNETSWNYVTGAVTKGASAGNLISWHDIAAATTQAGADQAAAPTKAIPGELVYHETGKIPTQDDYKSRTN